MFNKLPSIDGLKKHMHHFKDKISENQEDLNYSEVLELFNKRFKIKEKTLSTLYNANIFSQKNESKEIQLFFNLAAFVNILGYDILVISRDLIFAENKWQKKHYSRQATLIIYESINDLFELLGREFRNLTSKIHDDDFHLKVKGFRRKLNQYKEDNFQKLQEIRNSSIAHRDKDSLKQLYIIITIDEDYILKITLEFESLVHELENLLQIFFEITKN